jgi:hypothetical protein
MGGGPAGQPAKSGTCWNWQEQEKDKRRILFDHITQLRQNPLGPKMGSHTRQILIELSSLQRNLPARGFRPAAMLAGCGVFMIYGWYKLTKGIREQK